MKASDLKPCPFDGRFPRTVLFSDEGEVEVETKYYVKCDYCGVEGPHSTTEDGACNSWNHRKK
jgi:Lar family restriction alleviation protein